MIKLLKSRSLLKILTLILGIVVILNITKIRRIPHQIRSYIGKPPAYQRHTMTSILPCDYFFDSNVKSDDIHNDYNSLRITITDTDDIKTDCSSIRSRGYYPNLPLSDEEAEFPLAFSRVVNKDYLFIETMFRQEYQPQNVFCYSLDEKADFLFKKRMRDLQKCFPNNVIISSYEYNINERGFNLSIANWRCVEELMNKKWEYIFLLQNFDVKIKTNRELIKILKNYHGANDVGNLFPRQQWLREGFEWTFSQLNLFKNQLKNLHSDQNERLQKLKVSKSFGQVTLSRAACDYIVDNLDLTIYIKELESGIYAQNELFISTLNNNENVGIPGGYTMKCLDKKIQLYHPTRLSVYSFNDTQCGTKRFRNFLCIFGVEDLKWIDSSEYFFVNKLMTDYDYGALECMMEKVYNRTYFEPNHDERINMNFYQKLGHVRYNRLKNEDRLNEFTC